MLLPNCRRVESELVHTAHTPPSVLEVSGCGWVGRNGIQADLRASPARTRTAPGASSFVAFMRACVCEVETQRSVVRRAYTCDNDASAGMMTDSIVFTDTQTSSGNGRNQR